MRKVIRFGIGALVVVAILVAGGVLWLRSSLPQVRGRVTLAGLERPVEVVRDRHDVPHIFAATQTDAVFALGFVHAQDRLWQMDFQRRVGAGRLSEVLGTATVDTDRFLRTLGVYRVAEASLAHLDARSRGLVDAYVAGVNAFVAHHRGAWPPEYVLLGVRPEPFRAADVVVWAKMMAWDLSGNWDDELLRARLIAELDPQDPVALVDTLWPGYPADAPVVVPDFRAEYRRLDLAGLWAVAPKPEPPGAGSNDWVLSGDRTRSGAPLLANDPHLDLGAPSLWYLAHLSAPGLDVIGGTLPGTPAVLLGRNDRIAWGFTNTGPDTQDLFLERLDPDDPTRYLTPGGSAPFETRQEVIRVKGGEDVVATVRSTRHGPVISDVTSRARSVAQAGGREDTVVALQWTALREDDVTLQAVLEMNVARDWATFTDALRSFSSPQQNIVYADVDGAIGYYAPGRIPVRRSGDGSVPVPGWTGAYDWTGWVPFEALPHELDPADGAIVTANNKVVPDDYPYYLTRDWSEPYRVERIQALLGGLDGATVADMVAIQADQRSSMALTFLPTLEAVTPIDEASAAALDLLRGWDGRMARDAAAPLIFAAWYRAFSRRVYADELGPVFEDFFGFHPLFLAAVLDGRAAPPPGAGAGAGWCDDRATATREGCADDARAALADAVAELRAAYGRDPARWRWGVAHRAYSDHPVFTNTPLRRLFDLAIPNGGDAFTVDAARFDIADAAHPYRQTTGPGFRAVYDLSRPGGGRAIHSTGQSGNALSRFYRSYVRLWRDNEAVPLSLLRADAERGARGTLVLEPATP